MRGRQLVMVVSGLALFAGAVGLALLIFRAKEDRPPIIVKGGSIHFEGCADPNGNKKPWKKRTDGRWRPDHSRGKDVSQFHVEIVSNNSGSCGKTPSVQKDCGNGHLVEIRFVAAPGSTVPPGKFEFDAELNDDLGRWEPVLKPDVSLTPSGAYQLDYGSTGGTITVAVDGRTCNTEAGTVIRLEPIP